MTTRMFLGIVIQQVISVVTKELWNGTMRRVFGFFYLTEHHCEGTSSVPDGILKYYEGSVKQCEATIRHCDYTGLWNWTVGHFNGMIEHYFRTMEHFDRTMGHCFGTMDNETS